MSGEPAPGNAEAVRRALREGELAPAGAEPHERVQLAGMVLDAVDPQALARFYQGLLGWVIEIDTPAWAKIVPADASRPSLAFQADPAHRRPSWPAGPQDVQMQAHLDLVVDDLDRASARAESLGALPAGHQPQRDVRVYLDPEGHPFCLFLPGA